jgi:hypothetical protein
MAGGPRATPPPRDLDEHATVELPPRQAAERFVMTRDAVPYPWIASAGGNTHPDNRCLDLGGDPDGWSARPA